MADPISKLWTNSHCTALNPLTLMMTMMKRMRGRTPLWIFKTK